MTSFSFFFFIFFLISFNSLNGQKYENLKEVDCAVFSVVLSFFKSSYSRETLGLLSALSTPLPPSHPSHYCNT